MNSSKPKLETNEDPLDFSDENENKTKHNNNNHATDKPFPCQQCHVKFRSKSTLQTHISFVHEGKLMNLESIAAEKEKKFQQKHVESETDNQVHNEEFWKEFKIKVEKTDEIPSIKCENDNRNEIKQEQYALEVCKPFPCLHCTIQFKHETTLQKDISFVHEGMLEKCPRFKVS